MSATCPHERSAACGPPTRTSAQYCPPIAATLTPNERGRVAASCARLQPRSSVEKFMGRVATDCRRLCVPAARPQILPRQTTVPRVNHSGLCRIARAVIPGMLRRRAFGLRVQGAPQGAQGERHQENFPQEHARSYGAPHCALSRVRIPAGYP